MLSIFVETFVEKTFACQKFYKICEVNHHELTNR